MGAFDDLIPQGAAPKAGNAFADLVPPADQSTAMSDLEAGALMLGQVVPGLRALDAARAASTAITQPDFIRSEADKFAAVMGGTNYVGDPGAAERIAEAAEPQAQAAEAAIDIPALAAPLISALPGIMERQEEIAAIPVNPAAQDIMNAETFGEALSATGSGLVDDPYGVLRTMILRSLPASAPSIGAAIAGQAVAGPGGAATGAAAGEFLTEAGISAAQELAQALNAAGVDWRDEASVQAFAAENPEALREVVTTSLKRAGIIAATGAVSGGVSGQLARNAVGGKRVAANVAGALAVEPTMEGVGEALAGGTPGDVFAEVLGGAGQGAVQTAGQLAVEAVRASRSPRPASTSGTPPSPAVPLVDQTPPVAPDQLETAPEVANPEPITPKPASVTVDLFRGVGKGVDPYAPQDGGRFLSPDRSVAETYARGDGEVISEKITFENPLISQNWGASKQMLGLPLSTDMQGLISAAKEAGYDSINHKKSSFGEEWIDLRDQRAIAAPVEPQQTSPVEPVPVVEPKRVRRPLDPDRPISAPVVGLIKERGGIDPNSPVADDLRRAGVDQRRFPALFRHGGLKGLDTIVVGENEGAEQILNAIPPDQPGGGFFEAQDVFDAVIEEAAGTPRRTAGQWEKIKAQHAKALEYEIAPPPDIDTTGIPAPDQDIREPQERFDSIRQTVVDAAASDGITLNDTEAERITQSLDEVGGSVDNAINWFIIQEADYVDTDQPESYAEIPFPDFGEIESQAGSLDGKAQPVAGPADPRQEGAGVAEPEGGSPTGAGPQQPVTEDGPARAGTEEGGSVDLTPEGRQTVIPGAERITDREQAERAQEAPKRGGDAAMPEDSLFNPRGPELFDASEGVNQNDTPTGKSRNSRTIDAANEATLEGESISGGVSEIDVAGTLAAMQQSMQAVQQASGKKARRGGPKLTQALDTQDAVARDMATKSGSKAFTDLVDALRTQAGGTVTRTGGTIEERFSAQSARAINKIGAIVEKLSPKADKQAIVTALRTGNLTRLSSGEKTAVKEIRGFLKDQLGYLRNAGVNVGEVKENYFPREYDTEKVMANRDAFITGATALYEADLSNPDADPREQAIALADNIILGPKVSFDKSPGEGQISPFASRAFGAEADQLLGAFMENDLERILMGYAGKAARRAEISREFGDQFSEFDERYGDQMRQDGVTAEDFEFMRGYIGDQLGIPRHRNQPRQVALQTIHAMTIMGLLEHATITSLPEIITPAIRAGNLLDLIVTPLVGLRDLIIKGIPGLPKSQQMQALDELAQDLGVFVNNSYHSMQLARFADNEAFGRRQQKALAGYFRATGLEQFTQYTRLQALRTGMHFIRRAADGTQGKHILMSKEMGSDLLAEIGIQPAQHKAVADFLAGIDGIPTPDELQGETGEMIREALYRFVDQSIMRPNAGTKPAWAIRGSNSLGQFGPIIFALQSFGYAFAKNVVGRGIRSTGKAGKAAAKGRFGDAALYGMPAFMTIALLPLLQYAVGEAKDDIEEEITGKERNLTDAARIERAISRAGLVGAVDPYIQMYTGTRYGRSGAQALAGPVIGGMADAFDDLAGLTTKNSDNTNTAERRVTDTMWKQTVDPAVGAIVGLTMPNIIGFGVLNAARYGREGAVDAIAGPANKRSGGGEIQGLTDIIGGALK